MTVVVTQAPPGSVRAAERLRAEGFRVEECPLVRTEPLEGPPLPVERYDWLVVTSRNAVAPLLGRASGALPPVAVIGPGTAEAAREHGIEPALVARRSTQEGLVAELRAATDGDPGRVLFAGAEDARDVLVTELDADFVPLYRTREVRPERLPDADLVVLASASAARSLAALGAVRPCVSIGPVTSAEARRHGLPVAAEAETHDLEGLVAAVKLAASRTGSSPS